MIYEQLLQPGVLLRQRLQAADIGYVHDPELRLLVVNGRPTEPVAAAHFRLRHSLLLIDPESDDLLLGEPLLRILGLLVRRTFLTPERREALWSYL